MFEREKLLIGDLLVECNEGRLRLNPILSASNIDVMRKYRIDVKEISKKVFVINLIKRTNIHLILDLGE